MYKTDNPNIKYKANIKVKANSLTSEIDPYHPYGLLKESIKLAIHVYGTQTVKKEISSILSNYDSNYIGYGYDESSKPKCNCGESGIEQCYNCNRWMCEKYLNNNGSTLGSEYICEECYDKKLKDNLI